MRVFRAVATAAALLLGSTSAHDIHPTVTCSIKLDWTTFESQRSPFNQYRVKVRAADGTFQPVRKLFRENDQGRTEGIVPMWTLTNKPFNLKNHDEIIVQVSALMKENHWGNYLRVNKESEATVFTPPAGIQDFRTESMTRTSMKLAWNQFPTGRPATSYWILKSNGPSDPYARVGVTSGLDYTVDNLADGRTFLFKLRANNVCGYIESHPLTVKMGVAPITGQGEISTSGCNAVISWPTNAKGDFTSQIQIKNKDGFYSTLQQCGKINTKSCTFHMSALKNEPFSLAEGTVFEGRVRTCSGGQCSDYSALENILPLMYTPPHSVDESLFEQLVWTNQYDAPVSNVQLKWENFAEQYDSPGEIKFRLDVCKGEENCATESENWTEVTMTTEHSHVFAWVDGIENYKFRVTACNACGCSKSCIPLVVRRVRVPHPCECPTVVVDQCKFNGPNDITPRTVNISWKRPHQDGGAPIEQYKVEVLSTVNAMSWVDITNFCPRFALTREMTCSFDQTLLEADNIALKPGHKLHFRVSAANMAGWSPSTPQCARNNVLAIKTPPSLPLPRITQEIHHSLKVCYKACESCQGYELAWNAQDKERFMRPIENKEAGCQLITSLVPGSIYNVCVRSDDQCGESCKRVRVIPPPRPPSCQVGICDEIDLRCTCNEQGDSLVKSYQIEVKHASNNKWVTYQECGDVSGAHLNCKIPHAWLAANTDHTEGESIVMRARAYNQYGWGATGPDLITRYVSDPKKISTVTVSENYRKIAWSGCGAADCEYTVTIESPLPKRTFSGIESLSYTLPDHYEDATYQYRVEGRNDCGSTSFCQPIVPIPTFTQTCPTIVTMQDIVDECDGNESRIVDKMYLECKHATKDEWVTIQSCVIQPGQPNECAIDEGNFMAATGHKPDAKVQCRSSVDYESGKGPVSRENVFTIPDPQPFPLEEPTMVFDTDHIKVNWVDDAELWCMVPGQDTYNKIDTLGLRSHVLHAQCGQSYACMTQRKNICWLPPSTSPVAVLTPPCPEVFVPECFMQPVCMPNALGDNSIDYVRVSCSSPLKHDTIIESFKFEIRTGYNFANNEAVWKEYSKCNGGNKRKAPQCLIPMSIMDKEFGLKDHDLIRGRVTATPEDVNAEAVTSNCNPVDRNLPVHLRLAPKPISLTSTQTSNEATVCWNNPFYNPSINNKINLYWINGDRALESYKTVDFAKGTSQEVTNVAENCLKIDLRDGWTTFLAIADNGCTSVSSTISIQLTDCPQCHHSLQETEGHHSKPKADWKAGNDKHEKPGNSFAGSTDANVIDGEGKTVNWDTNKQSSGSINGICRVPRKVEQPVVTLNSDMSATIAWNSKPLQSAEFDHSYEVVWDDGAFWEAEPRSDIIRVKKSPYVWKDLNPLVTYRFAVRALNDCGAGPFSESSSVVAN